MEAVTLSQISENKNLEVITIGLNSKCKNIICSGQLSKENGTLVFTEKNIGMIVHEFTLSDYFLNTPENKIELKKQL